MEACASSEAKVYIWVVVILIFVVALVEACMASEAKAYISVEAAMDTCKVVVTVVEACMALAAAMDTCKVVVTVVEAYI